MRMDLLAEPLGAGAKVGKNGNFIGFNGIHMALIWHSYGIFEISWDLDSQVDANNLVNCWVYGEHVNGGDKNL